MIPGVTSSQATSVGVGGGGGDLVLDDVPNVTGAYSLSRQLITGYAGPLYDASGGQISNIRDQSGHSDRDLTSEGNSAREPDEATGGPNSLACADFDGSAHSLNSSAALSEFIQADGGYVIATVIVDATPTSAVPVYNNGAIVGDEGGYMGLYVVDPTGPNKRLQAYAYDGEIRTADDDVLLIGTIYVVEWRLQSGFLFQRVNGGSEVSVAVPDDIEDLTGQLSVGDGYTGNSAKASIKLFEMAVCLVAPPLITRNEILADFMEHAGAA